MRGLAASMRRSSSDSGFLASSGNRAKRNGDRAACEVASCDDLADRRDRDRQAGREDDFLAVGAKLACGVGAASGDDTKRIREPIGNAREVVIDEHRGLGGASEEVAFALWRPADAGEMGIDKAARGETGC